MKIGIVDADLIGRDKHRFPNLVCEKISAYWKERDAEVMLLTDYNWNVNDYDRVYVSKVFTDTPTPEWIKDTDKIHIGGTGFYFDQAPNLPDEIEHHMPDYSLYDKWIEEVVDKERVERKRLGKEFNEKSFRAQFREYKDCSIGFLTRGCFRKCGFCVNKKYDHVFQHSPLEEFYDHSRKSICLLDDNFFGCLRWKPMLEELIATGKKFKFKQGLDERLLTDEKCRMLFSSNYDGDFTFAFDVKSQMESETMSLFDDLVWKENTYGRIEFDDNFRLNLFSKGTDISCIETTSAAERELLALAFTIALHRVSGHDSPLFIDTPVGRVSDNNRENFAKTLVNVSTQKQIVLAFTPSEYSDEIRGFFNQNTLSSQVMLKTIGEEITVAEDSLWLTD